MSNEKTPIMARVSVQPFVGYHLLAVALRGNPKQSWAKAVIHYGRTDTLDEAWGVVSELTGRLTNDAIREDLLMFRWPDARDALRAPGEARRFEGAILHGLGYQKTEGKS